MRDKALRYIRARRLLHAGNRVAIAVSGGADSVALLRVLLELRPELGIVLAVAHFNHRLRGEESLADEAFVGELAKEYGLELFVGHADVRDHALTSKLGIEAAARELRYEWLARLAAEQRFDAIATAHTLDDQAETVLLKFLRGSGTRGLAGIYPVLELEMKGNLSWAKAPFRQAAVHGAPEGTPLQPDVFRTRHPRIRVVRPMLCIARDEVETYLESLGQSWREDESNLDRRFTRNRVRHDLLPLLEREFNPNIRTVISDAAEVANAEEDYWQALVERELASRVRESGHLVIADLPKLPLALQRRLLKAFAEAAALTLDFEHIDKLRRCALGDLRKAELPSGWLAERHEEFLKLQPLQSGPGPLSYQYFLSVPGQVTIPELGLSMRAILVAHEFAAELPPGSLLSGDLLGPQLTVRNWRPGDRFWPTGRGSEEKLKRLFAEKRIPTEQRLSWPVVLKDDQILWVRGFPAARAYAWNGLGPALKIDVLEPAVP